MLPHDLKKAVGSKSQGDFTAFFGMDCPLSNFYPSSFTVNGVNFNCSEQYYYFRKAQQYRDYDSMVEILAEHDPVQIKRIGRSVHGADGEWSESSEARDVMYTGLLSKFKQNSYLAQVLESTGEDTLVEANPHDSVWGIGLGLDNPNVFNQREWKGNNQMGDILMAVRHTIRLE